MLLSLLLFSSCPSIVATHLSSCSTTYSGSVRFFNVLKSNGQPCCQLHIAISCHVSVYTVILLCWCPPLISKVGLDRASIVGKLKPTAAILEGPPEEYSGVTETKIKTLTFSTESWRTKCVDWILITWQSFPLPFCDATVFPKLATIKSYCEAHKIV